MTGFICPKCGHRKHLPTPCPICNGAPPDADVLAKVVAKLASFELVLTSKRGKKVEAYRECAECGRSRMPVWRYAESNLGPVFLCAPCKIEVFDRSHGHIDALAHADTGGGAFEMNRRKH